MTAYKRIFVMTVVAACALGASASVRLPDSLPDITADLLALADTNADGRVSYDELSELLQFVTPAMFGLLDADGDGFLCAADLNPEPACGPRELLLRIVRQADVNNDGAITLEEARTVVPALSSDTFELMDRNDDGVLSREDIPTLPPNPLERLYRALREADANEDGVVTFEEFQALFPSLPDGVFNQLDRNGDGVLDIEDAPAAPVDPIARIMRWLADADANADGGVSFEELQAVLPDVTEELFNAIDQDGDGLITLADLPDACPDPREGLLRILADADTDGDGAISWEEFDRALPELGSEAFDRLDLNGDGVLTVADLPPGPIPAVRVWRIRLLRMLCRVDTNLDGALDYGEVMQVFPDAPAELFAVLDSDGDGVLTRQEIRAALGCDVDGTVDVPDQDVNGDGATNAVDIQLAINHALGQLSIVLPADVNGDGRVNSTDIQAVVNATLVGDVLP